MDEMFVRPTSLRIFTDSWIRARGKFVENIRQNFVIQGISSRISRLGNIFTNFHVNYSLRRGTSQDFVLYPLILISILLVFFFSRGKLLFSACLSRNSRISLPRVFEYNTRQISRDKIWWLDLYNFRGYSFMRVL